MQSNDTIFEMQDRDCDVVIFGDSTAMTGIDPRSVERNTGFKTCNIAVTNAVLAVTHTLTLDRFLSRNGKPRVLLIQLSPDGFQPESSAWSNTIYPEGILELLRHGNPAQSRIFLLHHPQEAFAFAGYAAGFTAWSALKELWFRLTGHRSDEDSVAVTNGFFTPPSAAMKSCEPAKTLQNNGARGEYARQLVERYEKSYADSS